MRSGGLVSNPVIAPEAAPQTTGCKLRGRPYWTNSRFSCRKSYKEYLPADDADSAWVRW